jgi:VWFA-related protein
MQPKRFPGLTSTLVLLALAAGASFSQTSQIRTRVDLVVVPVSVRDNNGFLIPGLQQADFSVLEDGKPQAISFFSVDPQPLSAAIVIDDGMSGTALKRLVPLLPTVAGAFVADDEMTSFRYDHFVWRLSDFTNDPTQIEKSFSELDRIAQTRPEEIRQPALYDKIEKKTPAIVRAIAGLFGGGGPGVSATPSPAPAPRTAPESRLMHSAINEAATALQERDLERQRIILLISDGTVSEPQTSVIPGRTLNSFDKNVELLLKNQVQVYSVDSRSALLERPSGMLDAYAKATGGDVYGGGDESDMAFALRRITEQARTQYVLGYVSNNTPPRLGVNRKIEVKVGDPDQKLKVNHRRGYLQLPIPK